MSDRETIISISQREDELRQIDKECDAMLAAAKEMPRGVLCAMPPEEKAAHEEFREAAREARATQEAAQRAAKRYAEAVRRLSEVCAPPTVPNGE